MGLPYHHLVVMLLGRPSFSTGTSSFSPTAIVAFVKHSYLYDGIKKRVLESPLWMNVESGTQIYIEVCDGRLDVAHAGACTIKSRFRAV